MCVSVAKSRFCGFHKDFPLILYRNYLFLSCTFSLFARQLSVSAIDINLHFHVSSHKRQNKSIVPKSNFLSYADYVRTSLVYWYFNIGDV